MKKGCLLLLALWIGMGFLYYYLFQGTILANNYWLPPLLGLLFTIAVANLHGITFSLRQRAMSKKSVRDWKDGEMVAVGGKITPVKSPVKAPFSGRDCVIVEYEIERDVPSGDSTSKSNDALGFLMAPCAVQTQRGPVRLIGFPMLAHVEDEYFGGDEDYRRAAQYIKEAKFKDKPSNPFKLISAINEVLNDPDGEVKEDFKDKGLIFSGTEDFADEDNENEDVATTTPDPAGPSEDSIIEHLRGVGYELEEKVILAGAEVAVFGTYVASKQSVNVGAGLRHIMHSVQPGRLEDIVRKNIKKAVIASIVWCAILGVSNYFTFKSIGVDLGEIFRNLV